jgi:hypothetical protein
MVLAAPLLRTVLLYKYTHGALSTYWLMPCRLDALGLGVVGAILFRNEHAFAYLNAFKWRSRTHGLMASGY